MTIDFFAKLSSWSWRSALGPRLQESKAGIHSSFAEERLSTNVRGEIIYRFKKPWDDGTSAIKLTQMEFMERLAALNSSSIPRQIPKYSILAYFFAFNKYSNLLYYKYVHLLGKNVLDDF